MARRRKTQVTEEEIKTTIGPDANGRYYYKTKSGKGLLSLKSPLPESELENHIEITGEEFEQLKPQPHVPSATEKAKRTEIAQLKHKLAETDYCIIKIAEGVATVEEYAEVIAQRATWRARINELEGE